MSVSPDSSVSQCDVNSLAVDSRPFFPFEVFTQLDGMSPAAVRAVQSMYEAYCQACVSVAKFSQLGSDGSGSSSGTASSASSRPNRRQRRRASRKARSRGSSSMSQRSAVQTADFQVGYCYLALIKEKYRSAVSVDLGINPSLADLARLPLEQVDLDRLDDLRFERVSVGKWHCGQVGLYSVHQVMSSLRSVYCTVVGTFGSKFESSTDLQVSLSDQLGFLSPTVSAGTTYDWTGLKRSLQGLITRAVSEDIFAYSLESPYVSDMSSLTITGSTVCRARVYEERPSTGSSVARFEVVSRALTVAKCPAGASVELNGLVLDGSQGSVFIVFKGVVSFDIRCSGDVEYVDIPFMVGSRTLCKAVELVVPAKSTSARFFRDQGGTAVLRAPCVTDFGAAYGCGKVSVTDPLQEWCAIQEDRFEGQEQGGISSYVFRVTGWQALTAFRSEGVSKFILNRVVQVCDSDSVVIVDHSLRLDVSELVGRWSFRRRYVADDYAMDGGGPSDSEFSDAL